MAGKCLGESWVVGKDGIGCGRGKVGRGAVWERDFLFQACNRCSSRTSPYRGRTGPGRGSGGPGVEPGMGSIQTIGGQTGSSREKVEDGEERRERCGDTDRKATLGEGRRAKGREPVGHLVVHGLSRTWSDM